MPTIALVVVQPFASYAKGDQITDPNTVNDLLKDHPHHVVKVAVPDPDPPAKAARS